MVQNGSTLMKYLTSNVSADLSDDLSQNAETCLFGKWYKKAILMKYVIPGYLQSPLAIFPKNCLGETVRDPRLSAG